MRYVIPVPFHIALAQRMIDNPQPMRTHLIFGALLHVQNRYQLCRLASKATQRLHIPNHRVEDTISEVLTRLKHQIPSHVSFSYGKTEQAKHH